MAKRKKEVLNRHDHKGHKVSANAHAKGGLKIKVSKSGGKKRKGSKKTFIG
jgi:hypothetical protein